MVSLNALWPFELEGLKSNWQVFNFHLLLHTLALFLFLAVAKGGDVLIGSNVYLYPDSNPFGEGLNWVNKNFSLLSINLILDSFTPINISLQFDESVWTDRGWFIEPIEAFLQLYNWALGIVKAVPNRVLKFFCISHRLIHIAWELQLPYWS